MTKLKDWLRTEKLGRNMTRRPSDTEDDTSSAYDDDEFERPAPM